MTLQDFLNTYLGQGSIGDTPDNKGQCTGLVAVWADNLGAPHDWGNAKDLLSNADSNFYEKILNTPNNFPVAGDIAVWNANEGGGYGHTGIVIAANVFHLATFDQNYPVGSPAQVINHSYNNIIGWIRKK